MTIEEARDLLKRYNTWRRDNNVPNSYEMPDPKEIGIAIDVAISALDDLVDLKNKYYAIKEKYSHLLHRHQGRSSLQIRRNAL